MDIEKACNKLTTKEMEIAVAAHFDSRTNIIVPNVFWGLGFRHECDVFVITKSGVGYEVEIKTNKPDIIADRKKQHKHYDRRISVLWFAVPGYISADVDCVNNIPGQAGILSVFKVWSVASGCWRYPCEIVRKPKRVSKYRFSVEERLKLAHLGAMRVWKLKRRELSRNGNGDGGVCKTMKDG